MRLTWVEVGLESASPGLGPGDLPFKQIPHVILCTLKYENQPLRIVNLGVALCPHMDFHPSPTPTTQEEE